MRQRPEEEISAKGYLCSLLTSPVMEVKFLAENFLFELCKQNVRRFLKHFGYGNAAGLLARKGLMTGGNCRDSKNYSEDEDSDTEEHRQHLNSVNPISGCIEPVHPSRFEGMSEEQKEHEAVKLANIIDRLHSLGVVKPGKLGKSITSKKAFSD